MMEFIKGFVLLFKAAKDDGSDPYEKALKQSDVKVFSIPVLSFRYLNLERLEHSLRNPSLYSGLVLTSQRALEAVEEVKKQHENLDLCNLWKDSPVFVVGKSTAEAAEKLGFVTTGSESGNAEALAPIILERISGETRPVFFPCGNLRKETIPKILKENGYEVENLEVYETFPDPNIKKNLQDLLEKEGIPEVVCYFSPSGVQYTKSVLEEFNLLPKIKFVSMGPSTTSELQKQAMLVEGEAKKPTKESVIDEILKVLRKVKDSALNNDS